MPVKALGTIIRLLGSIGLILVLMDQEALAACRSRVDLGEQTPPWAEAWLEENIRRPMHDGQAAILSVSLVAGGKIVAAEGYGCNGGPGGDAISAESDRFLTASITKTFTALAVKRLVDDGRISSLDDPANLYLQRIALPNWKGKAVTIRHLLTHSSGFEERGFGYVRHGLTTIPADARYAQAAIPALVRRPGSAIVYANINPPILGVLIEDLVGMPLNRYMREEIFAPLGMQNTQLGYEPEGTAALAVPWSMGAGGSQAITHRANAPFFAPTGSVEATALDMARYAQGMMRLSEQTQGIDPLTPLAQNHPALPALGMAWFIDTWNGTSVAQHAGAFGVFASWIVLVPERQAAVFIGWAGLPTGQDVPAFDFGQLRDSFLASLLGPPEAPPFQSSASSLPRQGLYRPERRPHCSPEVLLAFGSEAKLSHAEDSGFFFRGRGPYKPIGDDVFAAQLRQGRAPSILVVKDGVLLEAANLWKPVSGISHPAFQKAVAGGGTLLALTAAALAFRERIARAWCTLIIPLALVVAALVFMAPGPDGSTFFTDIFDGRTWRLGLLYAAGAAASTVLALSSVFLFQRWGSATASERFIWSSSVVTAIIFVGLALSFHIFTTLSLY